MGRARRHTPAMLCQKVSAIRKYLGFTQTQMAERLTTKLTPVYPGHVSEYERDAREPPLLVILQYARLAQVPMDVLADDDMDLPDRITFTAIGGRELYERMRYDPESVREVRAWNDGIDRKMAIKEKRRRAKLKGSKSGRK